MDEAARLRAQKEYSTDPEYLESMALEEEARGRSFRLHVKMIALNGDAVAERQKAPGGQTTAVKGQRRGSD
jgi:hypothetical protein